MAAGRDEALPGSDREDFGPRPPLIMMGAGPHEEYGDRRYPSEAFGLLGKEELEALPVLIQAAVQGK